MQYLRLPILFLLLATTLFSDEVATLRHGDQEITFGNSTFSIVFDAKTGTWKKLLADGKPVLATNRTKIPFDLCLEKSGRMLSHETNYKLIEARTTAPDTINLTIEAGILLANCTFQLSMSDKMIRQSCTITHRGSQTLPIYRFETALPRAAFSGESYYSCPVIYPRIGKRSVNELSPGKIVQNWRDPCVTIIQLTPAQTVMTMVDRTRPYGDITRTAITEMPSGIGLSHTVEACGRFLPGTNWKIGDFYCWLQDNNGDTAQSRIHQWMDKIAMRVPPNRNPNSKNAIIYSFHPGQPGHPFQDWGGFSPSTRQLPRIRNLNCNTVWLLPVESECPYIPDDFYKLANGIGTPKEYRQLIDTAHKYGMAVWQDVVPHGGRKTCRRAQEHPDWLLRDENGNVPRVRCFDYNHPDWQTYLGEVIRFYTKQYGLDGWRIDTSGFSDRPNWSKNIPYTRASWAMGQGGLAMMNAIRNNARKENPDAIILSECDGSIYGVATDIVYDFPLCRQVFKSIRTLSPDTFARELSAWLTEQNEAELKDLIRLRYCESHDEPRAELLYGPEPLRTGVALTAWIHGVPMLYKEMEDGHSAIFSKIMKIRRDLPILSSGKADYQSCRNTPGVFSCLRFDEQNLAIPVLNFNPVAVNGTIEIPKQALPPKFHRATEAVDQWNGRTIRLRQAGKRLVAEISLPAYGFTVLTPGTAGLEPPASQPAPPAKLLPYEAFLLLPDGSRKPLADIKPGLFQIDAAENHALIVRIDPGNVPLYWQVKSASGVVTDQFRTRHPFYNSMLNNMYSLPSGHNVLWSSVSQPLGFSENEANIFFYSANGSFGLSFPPENRPAAVFLIDRIGNDHAPHLVMVKQIPDTPLKTTGEKICGRISTKQVNPQSETLSGDPRLKRIAGGWLFDNGKLRLRIASNGSLTQAWQLKNTVWQSCIQNLQLELNSGYIGSRTPYSSANEIEAFQLFEKQPDGSLLLRFFGRPRGGSYYQILPPNALNYVIAYTLNDSPAFGFTCGIRMVTAPAQKQMNLSLTGQLSSSPDNPIPIRNDSKANGRFDAANGRLTYHWYKGDTPQKKFGRWELFSAVIGGEGIEPWDECIGRESSPDSGGILDPSFEFDYWGAFPDTVQMFCTALPWQMPFGSSISTETHHGKHAIQLHLTGKDEQRLKQRLTGTSMRAGEVWKLSAWVKAGDLKKKPSGSAASHPIAPLGKRSKQPERPHCGRKL